MQRFKSFRQICPHPWHLKNVHHEVRWHKFVPLVQLFIPQGRYQCKHPTSDQAPDQAVASMPSTKRDSSQKKPLCYHDVVKIVKGNFLGYYAIITKLGDLSKLNEDDEVKINYLKSFGKWAVASNDLDSRMICELTYIDSTIDRRSRYTIKE